MLAEVGSILIGLALAVALYSAGAAYWGIRGNDTRWEASGRHGVQATVFLLGTAFALLFLAFLMDQFSIQYVAQHSNRTLPTYLKVSAVWAGQEGSLLLWSFLQALFTWLLVRRPSGHVRPLVPWSMVFLNLITAFFVGVTLFLSNPFAPSPTLPADGQGLNPLLRHPGMIFHPPAMYLGYVGLAVPFALAMAALATGRVDRWPQAARRWTLAAWLFLGLGLLLGARWAYDVLGWGGYWGWDPVENAGLMPWLTATALLHGMVMQEERGGFRWWNLWLSTLSFALVLFGTFTTRSGLIQSVHAFSRSNLGPYFLGAIGLTLFGAAGLMFIRRGQLHDPHPPERFLSREGTFLLTLVVLVVITFSVFIGSVLPTLTSELAGQRFEAGPEWFDRVTGPQFAALVLLMGVCPLVGRSLSSLKRLSRRGLPALAVTAGLLVAAWLWGFTRPTSLVGFAIVALAGSVTASEYVVATVNRVQRHGESPWRAVGRLFARHRRRYGGYMVHTGVILMAMGIIGTRMYPFEQDVVLRQGAETTVRGYTLTYERLDQEKDGDRFRTQATLSVRREGRPLTTLYPTHDQYLAFVDQTATTPALHATLREDLYVVLAGWDGGGTMATFKVYVNALAGFIWIGGLVFLAGGVIALWPAAQLVGRAATDVPDVPEVYRRRQSLMAWGAVAVGVVVLAVAGWAMWGGGGTATPSTAPQGRPRIGTMAPGFEMPLMEEGTFSLDEMDGQVTVLNFWASWCPPCEDELPDFQAVWEEYRERDVLFVGITVNDDREPAEGMLARFGVTYPVGMDPDGEIAARYGITGVPETFILDAEGKVAYIHVGPVTAEVLRRELETIVR